MRKNSEDITINWPEKAVRTFGYNFATGAVRCIVEYLLWLLCIFIAIWAVVGLVQGHPNDDCDASYWQPCGLKVVTDHKTGIQYLVSPNGGIIRRERK